MTTYREALERLAHDRYEAGVRDGLDPSPWLDKSRDFIGETVAEIADAMNYTDWQTRRDAMEGRDSYLLGVVQNQLEDCFRLLMIYRTQRSIAPGAAREPSGGTPPCRK